MAATSTSAASTSAASTSAASTSAADSSADTTSAPTGVNTVVLRGHLSSEPRRRELPSGDVMVNLEVTTSLPDFTFSAPVVHLGELPSLSVGDEVVVVGAIRRRFYRAGGRTQSSTELVASAVLRPRQRRRVERALQRARAELSLVLDT